MRAGGNRLVGLDADLLPVTDAPQLGGWGGTCAPGPGGAKKPLRSSPRWVAFTMLSPFMMRPYAHSTAHGVAVDPRYIPMRTNLFVPEYGFGCACDTGGGIKRYHIDLGYDDDNYQSWHWPVDLYLLEPLPPADEIPWILP